MGQVNYLDLFSGIGGFHTGLEEAGFKFNWTGHSEIDKYAKSIYQGHFKESEDLGDVSNINVQDLPEIDLVSFGFPCQDLSIAGKRGGLQASRSGLFYQAIRIIKAKRPSYFIFENVKGLFSSNGGLDWLNVLREIADIGYDGQWQLLNTRWFLPQNRERVYFVGYPRERSGQQIFPIGEEYKMVIKRESNSTVVRTFTAGGNSGGKHSGMTLLKPLYNTSKNAQGARIYSPDGISQTISSGGGGLGAKTGLYEIQRHPLKFLDRSQKNIEGDYAFTISTSSFEHNNHVEGIRRLTPIECERLQGFPDNWTKYGKDGELISDTQRYKTLGNAVSVPVVKAVGRRIEWAK